MAEPNPTPKPRGIRGQFVCPKCSGSFTKLLSRVRPSTRFCSKKCWYAFQKPLAQRFWSKVSKGDGCWIWTGQTPNRYGRLDERDGSILLAHRVSWELHNGAIPEGLAVLHHCDNPPCVNPAHLFLGTKSDNARDMAMKNRNVRGERFSHSKLTDQIVVSIRERYAQGGITQQELADEFHVGNSQISCVVNRKTWKHVA